MSKDGPPISSGYRYGSLEAFRTGLPASATALRSKPTEDELKARETLVKFAAYPDRTKSIGKPLPATVGISTRQAANLRKIAELNQEERADKSVTLLEEGAKRLNWVYRGAHKNRLIEEDLALGGARVSIPYRDKNLAFCRWYSGHAKWIEKYSLP